MRVFDLPVAIFRCGVLCVPLIEVFLLSVQRRRIGESKSIHGKFAGKEYPRSYFTQWTGSRYR